MLKATHCGSPHHDAVPADMECITETCRSCVIKVHVHLLPCIFLDPRSVGLSCLPSVLAVLATHRQACVAPLSNSALGWLLHMSRCVTNGLRTEQARRPLPRGGAPHCRGVKGRELPGNLILSRMILLWLKLLKQVLLPQTILSVHSEILKLEGMLRAWLASSF